jgi:hypothetical protein
VALPLLVELRFKKPCCRLRRIFDGWYWRFINYFAFYPDTASAGAACPGKTLRWSERGRISVKKGVSSEAAGLHPGRVRKNRRPTRIFPWQAMRAGVRRSCSLKPANIVFAFRQRDVRERRENRRRLRHCNGIRTPTATARLATPAGGKAGARSGPKSGYRSCCARLPGPLCGSGHFSVKRRMRPARPARAGGVR